MRGGREQEGLWHGQHRGGRRGAQGGPLDEVTAPEAEGREGPWGGGARRWGEARRQGALVTEPQGRPSWPLGVGQAASGATGGSEQGRRGLPACWKVALAALWALRRSRVEGRGEVTLSQA